VARRLRIQYPGALYHVINRGNYRRDVFETVGAAHAFEIALGEACTRHGWLIHAFAIMRNHFHLALETPDANLVDGMHWLESTYASRFNRYRSEHGHLFQGRYRSLLVEDDFALARVVDYVHLNPVRANIVSPTRAADFRWSSLPRFIRGPRPSWLRPIRVSRHLEFEDSTLGWQRYLQHLAFIGANPDEQKRLGFDQLESGWAIGTDAWRQTLARDYSHLALTPDLSHEEIVDLRETRWRACLDELLRRWRKTEDEIARDAKGAHWKVKLAGRLRLEVGASYPWISTALKTLNPPSLRVAVHRLDNM
jgi:REP element-mobilizing transposase RayT